MPSVARSSAPTKSQAVTPEAASVAPAESQEALREGLPGGASAEGLANYQASLGTWLGSALYKQLSKQLAFARFEKTASSAWNKALMAAVNVADKLDGEGGDAALDPFREALKAELGGAASELLESDTGHDIVAGLSGWTDAHPRAVVMVALLAAAGAIATNMKVPELKGEMNLGHGFSASGSAKLGRLRNLALEEIHAQLEYSSGPLMAAAEATRGKDGETTYGLSAKLGDDSKFIKGDAKLTNDGLDVYGLHGLYTVNENTSVAGNVTGGKDASTQVDASLTRKDGDTTRVETAKYDAGTGVLSLKHDMSTKLNDRTNVGTSTAIASDGTASTGASVDYTHKGLTASGGVSVDQAGNATANAALAKTGQLNPNTKYSADAGVSTDGTAHVGGGLDYTKGDLAAKLSGRASTDGSGFVDGSVSNKFGNGLEGSAHLKQQFGADKRTTGGLDLSYHGDKYSGQAGYNYDSQNNAHSLNALGQRNFDNGWKGRIDGKVTKSNDGTSFDARALAYKSINDDVALFGGVGYRQDQYGGRAIGTAGVEVKGVPIEYNYDPATKQHSVKATLFSW